MHKVASWGYVVAAPRLCVDGVCPDDDYPRQQTNVIDWAKEQADDEIFQGVDFSGGVGIFGHSMGGRAALQNAAEPRAAAHDIRAAVMLHAFTPTDMAVPAIPFLAFTGTNDTTAEPWMTLRWYDKVRSGPRGLVNRVGAGHQEPSNWEGWAPFDRFNPKMAQYVVGWFRLFLDRDADDGVDWRALVAGEGALSLCHGGDGAMARCEVFGA